MTSNHDDSASTIFSPNTRQNIVMIFILVFIISGIIIDVYLSWRDGANGYADVSYFALLLFLMIFLCFPLKAFRNKIEFSSDGVTLIMVGFRLYSPWENIVAIRRIHPAINR